MLSALQHFASRRSLLTHRNWPHVGLVINPEASARSRWVTTAPRVAPRSVARLLVAAMDLAAIAGQKGDAWHNSAAAAAARMRGTEGFFIFRVNAADAATLQVRVQQSGCSIHLPTTVQCTVRRSWSDPWPVKILHERCLQRNAQAALAVAAPALDAQLQRDSVVSKVLIKVQPGSALNPAPPVYEQVLCEPR